MSDKRARVIAFYLPQFHPTPENDKYWGKGFTEWTNVTKSKPLFRGHYQPQLPADLGFYDLRLPVVREQQAEMARCAGVEGFMYWHYWFGNGRQTLQDIFEDVLSSGKPDFPFCLGWANHDWSNKTWTKSNMFQSDTMIFKQEYPGDDDYIAHFNYCLPAFRDHRYIRVDGKPLFYILSPKDMPDCGHFISLWRKLAEEAGLPGIHFCTCKYGNRDNLALLRSYGFDSINNFMQHEAENQAYVNLLVKKIRALMTRITHGVALRKFNYEKIIRFLPSALDREEYVYPTILTGYDRSPRSGRMATIYYNYTPQTFDIHVKQMLDEVLDKDDEHKIIFLKSWNEWGEGNYIEPNSKYGHQFLDVLKKHILS